MPTDYASYSLYLSPTILPLSLPAENPPCDLHFSDSFIWNIKGSSWRNRRRPIDFFNWKKLFMCLIKISNCTVVFKPSCLQFSWHVKNYSKYFLPMPEIFIFIFICILKLHKAYINLFSLWKIKKYRNIQNNKLQRPFLHYTTVFPF